jgi:antitoxin HicB
MSAPVQPMQEYLNRPYTRVLIPDEGGGYLAEVLELSGCLADGRTPDEAIHRLEESMEAWIETALELGKPIPEPLASQGYSGRLLLRMPRWMHREVGRRALVDGASINQWIVAAIGQRLGAETHFERVDETLRNLLERLQRLVGRAEDPMVITVEEEESRVTRRITQLKGPRPEWSEPGPDVSYQPVGAYFWRIAPPPWKKLPQQLQFTQIEQLTREEVEDA